MKHDIGRGTREWVWVVAVVGIGIKIPERFGLVMWIVSMVMLVRTKPHHPFFYLVAIVCCVVMFSAVRATGGRRA